MQNVIKTGILNNNILLSTHHTHSWEISFWFTKYCISGVGNLWYTPHGFKEKLSSFLFFNFSRPKSLHIVLCLLTNLPTVVCVRESTKSILFDKWSHFNRAKPILKILLASWTFCRVDKGFRSFNSENLGSIGQRVAKLLAIKLCTCTLFGLYGRRVYQRLRPRFEKALGLIILKV